VTFPASARWSANNVTTTNTTQFAIDVTAVALARCGGPKSTDTEAARERLTFYLPTIAAFIAGTAAGALGFHFAGALALAIPLAVAYAVLIWIVLT
jgi:uncharacterized membrane protein YoaK (UPF0700 family)